MARKKEKEKKPNKCDDADEKEEEVDELKIRTIKTQLKNILRPDNRNVLIQAISAKSIIATEVCCLASLLLLYRVEKAFEDRYNEFFQQNGDDIIRSCFYDVCQTNGSKRINKLDDEFRALASEHQIEWPVNSFFGNGMNDLIKTYTTNVKNNLKVHQAKRLRQFLMMRVYELNNSNPLVVRYTQKDIDRVISLAIYGRDSIQTTDLETVAERERRDLLLAIIIRECWYEIPHSNIGRYTSKEWFKSIQFWISLQRKIDGFNNTAEQRQNRQIQRAQYREKINCKRRNHKQCTCKQPESQSAEKGPPRVNNLSVIPICNFKRTHFTLDNSTLYQLLCETNIIQLVPNEKGKRGRPKRAISRSEFFKDKHWYWDQIFDMKKISRLVHGKKKFRNRFLSNGQSVSLQFDADQKDCIPFHKETIAREYKQNKFEMEAATDPGEHTWSATVVRDIKTGKEVY